MENKDKSKEQLLKELGKLNAKIAELEKSKTEYKQAEEALRESEAMMKSIFRAAPAGIGVVLNRNIQFINQTFIEMTGYSAEELIGQKARMMYPSNEEFDRVGKYKYEQIRKYGTGTIETQFLRKDGRLIDVLLSSTPIDLNDQSKGVTFTATDITERKQMEGVLHDRNEKLSTIINHSHEVFFIHDTNQQLTYVSPQCKKIFGYTVRQMMVKWTTLVTDNPINEEGFEFTEKAIRTGKRQKPYPLEIKRKDGELRWIEIDESPVKDANGKVIAISGAVHDITEHKQSEKALKENEEKFRDIIEMSPAGIATISLTGLMTSCNPAFLKLTGFEYNDLVGKHFTKLPTLKLKDMPKYLRMMKSITRRENLKPIEFNWVHKSGKDMVGEARFSVLKKKGKTTGFQVIAIDITEGKQVEEALKESELWSKEIFESSLDAILIVGSNSYFIDVNKAAASLTGYSKDELLKMSIPDLHEEKDLEAYNKFFKCIMDGESITSEAKILRKDGTKVDVEFSNKRFIIGSVSYMHTIARDVTKRKQAEERIKNERDKLQLLMDGLSQTKIGVDIVGIDYKVISQNQFLKDRFGDITGKICYEKYMGFDTPCDFCPMIKAIENNSVEKAELKRGDDRVYEIISAPLPDKEGTVNKVIEVVNDITERKKAEKALKKSETELRESEEKLKAQYKGIPIPTYTWQKAGKDLVLVDYNDAAEVITKGTITDCMGIKASEMYRNTPEIQDELKRCLAEKTVIKREMLYSFQFIVKSIYMAVKYAFVPPDLVLVHTEDITERKQAEEELKQKMKQLERFNRVAVDRELRMIELKRKINDLLEKAGLEKKYSSPD